METLENNYFAILTTSVESRIKVFTKLKDLGGYFIGDNDFDPLCVSDTASDVVYVENKVLSWSSIKFFNAMYADIYTLCTEKEFLSTPTHVPF